MEVSEKVIRRIMAEEKLVVISSRRRRYSAYQGEITPAVSNVLQRDVHAEAPSEKWLTDITEFQVSTSKVYLSPVIDCFDGMVVSRQGMTVERFIVQIDEYTRRYNEKRIKLSLEGMSPVEYRSHLGLTA